MKQVKVGKSILINGNCEEAIKKINANALITDPPYGIGDIWKGGKGHGWGNADKHKKIRNKWDERAPDKNFIEKLIEKTDQQIIWGGNYFNLPTSRCWYIWVKPERGFTLAEAEMAWTNFDSVVRVFECRRSDPGRLHPTQKPLELMKWCVGKTKGTVLDPYMGSGTTGVACAMMNREFIGIEANEEYFEIAVDRITKAYNQPDMFGFSPSEERENPTNAQTGSLFNDD